MNFSQEELKELQAINAITDQELGTRVLTLQESDAFTKTVEELFEQGFVVSKDNVLRLHRAFDNSPEVPMTRDTILQTTKVHRGHFAWKSAARMEYDQLAEKFSEAQRNLIAAWLDKYGYEITEPALLTNWNLAAKAFLARGYDVTNDNCKIVLGNVINSQQGYHLIPKAQKPKFNAQAVADEVAKAPKVEPDKNELTFTHTSDHPDSWVRPLSPELQAHRKSVQAAMEAAAKKKEPQSDSYLPSYWQTRVQQFLSWIPENVIRMELEPEFREQKYGNWELTYRELENRYERRKHERSVNRGGNF